MPSPTRAARLCLAAVLVFGLFGLVRQPEPAAALVSTAKVVIVVGPVGRSTAWYKREADLIYTEARRYTSNVVRVYTPNATWTKVVAAARGASVFVYFGHGNGYPSRYGAFDGATKDGMGLDPTYGADGTRHINYGEDRIRASIRFAPNAAVLLYRLCYASGNTEPGLPEGTTYQSMTRVDYYGAGFLSAGAKMVLATGYPSSPGNYVRQLFTTNRTMEQLFRAAPGFNNHVLGSYRSRRTTGMRYFLDPNRGGSDPAGFYRSAIGDLAVRSTAVTKRVTPTPTPTPRPTPTPTATPAPSATPTATPAPTPSATPAPSPTPARSPTPTATAAPTPSPTPEATPTTLPSSEPTPTPDATTAPTPTGDPVSGPAP